MIHSNCLKNFKDNDTFNVCFKRTLDVVKMDFKDRSQEEKEDTLLSLMASSPHLLQYSSDMIVLSVN